MSTESSKIVDKCARALFAWTYRDDMVWSEASGSLRASFHERVRLVLAWAASDKDFPDA